MSTQMKFEMFLQVQGMEKMDSEGLTQSQENCCLGRSKKSKRDVASKEVKSKRHLQNRSQRT